MTPEKPIIKYVYMGNHEVGKKGGGYRWVDGYSENGISYPWMQKRECQTAAKERGCKAVFVRKCYHGKPVDKSGGHSIDCVCGGSGELSV